MKVSVDEMTWQEPRFLRLCQALGAGRSTTVGTLVILWHATRSRRFVAGTRAELLHCLPWPADAKFLDALIAHGYVTTTDDGLVEVVGNAAQMRVRAARSQAGKQGRAAASEAATKRKERAARRKEARAQRLLKEHKAAKAQALSVRAARDVAKSKDKPPTVAQEANRAAWEAYSAAYQSRWGVVPVRNAKVNAQIKQFVQRVGQELSPRVLAFYISHNESEYLRTHHSMGPAVRDAEALVTQYHRDTPITSRDLQRFEEAHTPLSQLDRIARGEL